MKKSRLDLLLVARGLVNSRTKAQAMIKAGLVRADGVVLDKSGIEYAEDMVLDVTGQPHPWVSRGGMKLAHALAHFGLNVTGKIAIDVGASTGGFTDVLLQNGATKIYAVDVGHDQLDAKLRANPCVVVMEGINARNLTASEISTPADIVVCDASFISLTKVLPAALALTADNAALVTLIKPQFEVGKSLADKGRGVIRDAAIHRGVCDSISDWLGGIGWHVQGVCESPITGPKGNVEFLLFATKG